MDADQLKSKPPAQAQEKTEAPSGGINTAAKEYMRFLQKLLLENATANTPPEWRESLKLISAGLLGISLWFFIGWVACASYLKIQDYSDQISKLKDSKDPQIENIDKAVNIINDASKTLYSQLIPIATVVSGFFFVAANSQSSGLVALKNKTEPPEADKEEK